MAESTPRRNRGLLKLLHVAGKRQRRGAATNTDDETTFAVLRVQVIAAEHLPAADRSGTSDPFFRIITDGARVESPVVKRSLNPVWGNLPPGVDLADHKATSGQVLLDIRLTENTLAKHTTEIIFWDKDKFSKNDYLGEAAFTVSDWFPAIAEQDDIPILFNDDKNNARWFDLVNTKKGNEPAGRALIKIGLLDVSPTNQQKTIGIIREAIADRTFGRLSALDRVFSTPPTRSFGTLKRGERPKIIQQESDPMDLFDDASSTESDHTETDLTSSAVSDFDEHDGLQYTDPGEIDNDFVVAGSPGHQLQKLTIDTAVAPRVDVHDASPKQSMEEVTTPRASTAEQFSLAASEVQAKTSRPTSLRKLTFPSFRRSNSTKSITAPTPLTASSSVDTLASTANDTGKRRNGRKTPKKSSTTDSLTTGDEEERPKRRRLRRKNKAESWSFGAPADILGICFVEVSSAADLPKWKNAAKITFDMDPFTVISFGQKVFRTRVIRHSLNPKWEERLFFRVRKHEAAYNMEFGVFDWDRYSANDHVGIARLQVQDLIETSPVPGSDGLYACGQDDLLLDDNFYDFTLPLSGPASDDHEKGKQATLKVRARFTPYTALRQQFWRRYLRQFDTDSDRHFSQIELYAMLDSLGSTLSTETTDNFFSRYGKSTDATLSLDQVVACLESELAKEPHATIPAEADGTGTASGVATPGLIDGGIGFTGIDKSLDSNHKIQEPMDLTTDTILHSHSDTPVESAGGQLSPPKDTEEGGDKPERIINIRSCPICHKARLHKQAEVDIVTHLAICASQDWANLDNLMVSQFVSSEQAHRKWLGKMVSRVTKGAYQLGADSGNILVQNRLTGQLIEEKMQVYVRLGIRLGYRGMVSTVEGARVRRLFKSMSIKQGLKFDAPESAADIAPFIAFHGLDMNEVLDPVDSFKTFNQFFYRKLKPDARPVADPEDSRTLVSASDCRMMAFPTITEAIKIWIKGREFSIKKMLGDDYGHEASRYDGGSLAIFRLAPQDYHRYHCPVDGTIGKISKISGVYYTVNPMAIRSQVDVYGENIREIVPITSPTFGRVMLVTVGAMMVGSIIQTVKEGQTVKRGEEFGYFAFGGSTIVALFEKGVQFDQDIIDNSSKAIETLVRVGMRIGRKE